MNTIKILPQELINQIAAGEVIERPASVVKELVENAIDAGAKSISVEIEGTGLELIRISDDGAGMNEEELEIAIQRHATSKISSVDDLFAIRTLGFRGEALPSILSVSRAVISSRQALSQMGYSINVDSGLVASRTKKGLPPGTIIEISDLFFNTPARRKFLKTTSTEQRNIIDVVSRYALAYPQLRFSLEINNRVIFNFVAQSSLRDRANSVLGIKQKNNLIPFKREFTGITVHGLIAPPIETRQNRSGIYAYVNNRSVKDVLLASAIVEGYRDMLMKGRYPIAALFVEVNPSEVDVNVHPAKAEVRFKHGSAVFGMVATTIKETLSPSSAHISNGYKITVPSYAGSVDGISQKAFEVSEVNSVIYGPRALARMQEGRLFEETLQQEQSSFSYSDKIIVGMLHATYILLQDDLALYILDQHAAHERITFERLLAIHASGSLTNQLLINPIVLELTHQEYIAFEESAEQIHAMGIDFEPYGDKVIAIRAVPQPLSESDIKSAVYGLIHALLGGELHNHKTDSDLFKNMLATIACHSSIRAGKTLTFVEAKNLLKELDEIGSPRTCPHGRPLFRNITLEEIERWMGRRA